jgi:hypothetical protein
VAAFAWIHTPKAPINPTSNAIRVSVFFMIAFSLAPDVSEPLFFGVGNPSIDKFAKNQRKSRRAIANRLTSPRDKHSGNQPK